MSMLQRAVEVFALYTGVLLLRDVQMMVQRKLCGFHACSDGTCSVRDCPLLFLFLKQQNEFAAVFENEQVKH